MQYTSRQVLEQIYQHPALLSEDLQAIFEAHKPVSVSKGEYFLKTGQVAQSYFCLLSGIARSYAIDYEANDITTAFFSPAEIVIDVVSLFQRSPAQENIQALSNCTALQIDFVDFQRLFHACDAFSEWGRAWMVQALFQLKKRSVSMITDTAKDRYISLQAQHSHIAQQVALKYIATYLGITDTSLSRIRNELSKCRH